MKFSLAAAAAALASSATASIVSIQLPETIASGKPIPVKLVNNIDQSSTYQIGITFGFGTAPSDPGDMIGNPVASIFLQDGTMPAAPFTRHITLPDRARGKGESKVFVRAAIFGVYGAAGSLGTSVYGANITVGDKISDKYVEFEYID